MPGRMTAEAIAELSDKDLCDEYTNWRLDPATDPLPDEPQIGGESIEEYRLLKEEIRKRELIC